MPAQSEPVQIVVKVEDLFFLDADSYHHGSDLVQLSKTYFDVRVSNAIRFLYPDIDSGGSKVFFESLRILLKQNNLRMESLFIDTDNSLVSILMTNAFEVIRHKGENLLNFFVIRVSEFNEEIVLKKIMSLPGISYAYSKGQRSSAGPPGYSVTPADAASTVKEFFKKFDITSASSRSLLVTVVDVEQGWARELMSFPIPTLLGSGVNHSEKSHGANTVNVLKGRSTDSDLLQGLAGNAKILTGSIWKRVGLRIREKTEEQLVEIFTHPEVKRGDIVLLEIQTYLRKRGGYLPIEAEPALLHLITYAVANGVIVIEAAANGSIDMGDLIKTTLYDLVPRSRLQSVLDNMKKHSAIMVGAIGAGSGSRNISNYGQRVDCYCYGEVVNTFHSEGSGYLQFSATSLASAIVASLAARIQMAAKSSGRSLLPSEMRSMLKSDTDGHSDPEIFNNFIRRIP